MSQPFSPEHLRPFLTAFNAAKTDKEQNDAVDHIAKMLGTMEVLHVTDKKIDVEESLDSAVFAKENGLTSEYGCVAAETLRVVQEKIVDTDPVTLLPLRKGRTTQPPVVDWNPVSLDDRYAVGFAVETRQLPAGGSEVACAQVQQKVVPWGRICQEATNLREKFSGNTRTPSGQPYKPTEAERALHERCLGRVSHVKREDEKEEVKPRVPVVEPPYPGTTERASRPGTRILVLAHDDDKRFATALIKMLAPWPGTRVSNFDVPPGTNSRAWLTSEISTASLIVACMSADFIVSPLMEYVELAQRNGAVIAPYIVRPCGWRGTVVKGLQPINLNSDPDAYEASQVLRQILGT